MAENPGLAGLGPLAVPVNTALKPASEKKAAQPERSKYRDFLEAIKKAAFGEKDVDQQTRLEWENIEGEVIGNVLVQDLISGTMFVPIKDNEFTFKTTQECLDEVFVTVFVERFTDRRFLVPGVSVMNEKLNRLMVSYKGEGRKELIAMLQSFQVQMQEHEQSVDPMKKIMQSRGMV